MWTSGCNSVVGLVKVWDTAGFPGTHYQPTLAVPSPPSQTAAAVILSSGKWAVSWVVNSQKMADWGSLGADSSSL